MNVLAPRVSTGFGSNIPGLHRPSYGNLVLPQAGTLPVRRAGGLAGYPESGDSALAVADGEEIPVVVVDAGDDGLWSGVPIPARDPGYDVGTVEPAADFVVNVEESIFPWELLILGGALIVLMEKEKKGGRHAR